MQKCYVTLVHEKLSSLVYQQLFSIQNDDCTLFWFESFLVILIDKFQIELIVTQFGVQLKNIMLNRVFPFTM